MTGFIETRTDIDGYTLGDDDLEDLGSATLLEALHLTVSVLTLEQKNTVVYTHHDNGDVKSRVTISEYIEAALENDS